MSKENWVWMPHVGHLIVGRYCQFHLTTYVNGYIVSTVGEYLPDYRVRKIIAESRGISIEGIGDDFDRDYMKKIGFEEIGHNRLYETMVFHAYKTNKNSCCPYSVNDWCEIDMDSYNKPEDAYDGHLKMCEKYSQIDK